jgi:hypothetical protein
MFWEIGTCITAFNKLDEEKSTRLTWIFSRKKCFGYTYTSTVIYNERICSIHFLFSKLYELLYEKKKKKQKRMYKSVGAYITINWYTPRAFRVSKSWKYLRLPFKTYVTSELKKKRGLKSFIYLKYCLLPPLFALNL